MLPIDGILDKITHKDKSSPEFSGEYFLSLVVNEKQVQAGVWNFSKEGGECLSFGPWETWGGENSEELIVASDTSIASAISKLPEIASKQPTKVILGLPDLWVAENAIKKEKLDVLQNICKKLLLKPLGFVVTVEAIAHLLKEDEGGTPSLILIGIEESDISVSMIIQGKYFGTKIVGRSNSLAMDLEEGLLRFGLDGPLPSRIMILGGKSLEEEKQSLISYPWTAKKDKKIEFLQFPKIEISSEDFEMKAVVLAGSKELGHGEIVKNAPRIETKVEELPAEQEVSQQESPDLLSEENFGFIKADDILKVSPPPNIPSEERIEESVVAVSPEVEKAVIESPRERELFFKPPKRTRFILPLFFSKMGSVFRGILGILLHKGLAVVAIILIILSGLGFLFVKVTKSEVILLVQPQKISKEFDFTVSSKASSVDSEKLIVPAREITTDLSGKKSADVRGKKTVGDKAKGEVVIYNGTDKVKTLAKGAVVKGPEGLKFVLDASVEVPAKTTDINATPPVDKWGEKKANILAFDIGSQYNVAANSTLSLESLPASGSSFIVKNPSAFSGGTSREIQAVSKEDRDTLSKAIASEFLTKAGAEIKSKLSPTDQLLDDSILIKSKVDRFDKEIGDEASSLSIESKYTFSSVYFKEDDLKILIDNIMTPLITAEYQRQPESVNESFVAKDKTKGIYTAKVEEKLIPKVDSGAIAKKLKGKRIAQAESFLGSLPHVVGTKINIVPKVFSLLKFFPFEEKNITVSIESL